MFASHLSLSALLYYTAISSQSAQSMAGGVCTSPAGDPGNETTPVPPQMALLDFLFPGMSMYTGAVEKYLHIDLNLYIPLFLSMGAALFIWRYSAEYVGGLVERYLMSSVDVRPDDEIYNMIMGWVAAQRFAKGSRRFIANTNLNSRYWWLWSWDSDDDDDGEDDDEGSSYASRRRGGKKKVLSYTPTFGKHYFWYKKHLLIFSRQHNRDQAGFMSASEREEITISTFGRNPWILKELLHEARMTYMKRDEKKTLIYRGTLKGSTDGPHWQRCMARTARPFSTVILNEKVKTDLISDVTDYLDPQTRRWYANRGIPYRRGYLLHGPPGTGKSSLSLALAGFFKMRIYIVSLSSISASEENLSSLFAELPRRCVVLLEDIDTAGLTHTREEDGKTNAAPLLSDDDEMVPGQITRGNGNDKGNNNNNNNAATGRLSLSGLLNILDGVASQEGRVLIMTTNHVEKLDKALIRPGRVDMIVKFGLADEDMTAAIFRAIYAPLEGDIAPVKRALAAEAEERDGSGKGVAGAAAVDLEAEKKRIAKEARDREETVEKVREMSLAFAVRVPSHEFSPAELQGFLMKNKRDPAAALAGVPEWVEATRAEKKEKEVEDAKAKREAEEKAKKEKEEEAKKEKKKAKRKAKKEEEKKKRKKKSKGKKESDSESSDSDSSQSDSEVEAKDEEKAKTENDKEREAESVKEVEKEKEKEKEKDKDKDKDKGHAKKDSGYGTPESSS